MTNKERKRNEEKHVKEQEKEGNRFEPSFIGLQTGQSPHSGNDVVVDVLWKY